MLSDYHKKKLLPKYPPGIYKSTHLFTVPLCNMMVPLAIMFLRNTKSMIKLTDMIN